MNIERNWKTYRGLDKLADSGPSDEKLDEVREDIHLIEYGSGIERYAQEVDDAPRAVELLTAASLWLADCRARRALTLQVAISHGVNVPDYHGKEHRAARRAVAILRASVLERARAAEKNARALRAALKI